MDRRQTAEKLGKRIEEIKGRKLTAVTTIREFRAWRDERTEEIHDTPPEEPAFVMKAGETWGSLDGYLWLECRVKVPKAMEGEKAAGCFDFNSIHEGYASGFEAMLYIDGKPYQGIDENHRIVILDSFAGQEITLRFKLWAGITGGPKYMIYHQIREGIIGYLHPDVEAFGALSEMALGQAKELSERDGGRAVLLNILEESFRKIDWVNKEEGAWRLSLQKAGEYLTDRLSDYPDREAFRIHCVGHTHIDLAWMWRVKHTKEKGMRSFSTAVRLLEEFPRFRFFHSTPQLYQYIKELNPELYGKIKAYVKEGRWEPGGGMWVEADCNLPGGESLVRQILYGKRFFKEEFGVDTTYLWLPDAFGFPFCLPQLMKKSGMTTFFTSKLSWNKQNRFPHDTFRWRGMDGSEVLAYFLTTPAYGFPTQEWAVTYNGDINPKVLTGAYEIYQEQQWNQDVMLTYGHGDGGGGCTREMIQNIEAMEKVPFGPSITYSQPGEFFELVEKNVAGKDALPVWEGDLYLEYHRGTYTSQAFVKRANRKLEARLRSLEYLMVRKGIVCGKTGLNVENLENYWKVLLKNQFHDILPGSSIHEVYEDARADYEWLNRELDRLEEVLFDGNGEGYTLWNPGNWSRDCQIELPTCKEGFQWKAATGEKTETVRTKDGSCLLRVKNLAPLAGCRLVQVSQQETPAASSKGSSEISSAEAEQKDAMLAKINLEKRSLETERYLLAWNTDGSLCRLYDKELDFEVFEGEAGNRLTVYEDKPLMFDAWDIDSYYKEKAYPLTLHSVRVEENTNLRTILEFTYHFGNSILKQRLILRKEQEQIDFETWVDWKEQQCLLKTYFPIHVLAREAVFDTQFGNIVRSTTKNTSVEEAKFEVCAHRFVDVSQRDRGAAILNDCKYGHDVEGSTVGLTLIKSSVDPDDRADQGIHEFTYSICPHRGSWYESGIQRKAFEQNNPVILRRKDMGEDFRPLFELIGDYVELDAVKRAEDGNGFILRFHEYAGGDCPVSVRSAYPIQAYQECDLLEQGMGEKIEGRELRVTAKPYEIKSYRVFL